MWIKDQIEELTDKGLEMYATVQSWAFKLPFAKVERDKFLTKELKSRLTAEELQKALTNGPASVLSHDELYKIGNKTIIKDALKTAFITLLMTLPQSLMFSIPATIIDIIQAQIFVFIITQKLLYLYGSEYLMKKNDEIKKDIAYLLWVVSAVMIGRTQVSRMMKSASGIAAKKLVTRMSATKGIRVFFVNLIRQAFKWLGIEFSKETITTAIEYIAAGICGIIGAIVSLALFIPMANKLNQKLKEINIKNLREDMEAEMASSSNTQA